MSYTDFAEKAIVGIKGPAVYIAGVSRQGILKWCAENVKECSSKNMSKALKAAVAKGLLKQVKGKYMLGPSSSMKKKAKSPKKAKSKKTKSPKKAKSPKKTKASPKAKAVKKTVKKVKKASPKKAA